MKIFTVFYANLLYGEYDSPREFKLMQTTCGPEIYNGAYIYRKPDRPFDRVWYRMDFTPVLESDVPKELLINMMLLQ